MGFNAVHINDYLEYLLERCLQPGKAVNTPKGDDTLLVEAEYLKITAALPQEHTLVHTSSLSSHVSLSAKIPKETDCYAPWVETTTLPCRY